MFERRERLNPMKRASLNKIMLFAVELAVAVSIFAAGASASNDSLTGLPVYPGLTDPNPLPKANLCGKAMVGDFYIVMENKVDVVVSWYAQHLSGFKKYHAVVDGRSQDTFWSSDGTQEVTVTGTPNSSEVYSVSYGKFTPGLSAPQMATFNTGKQVCK
jgi:hypothetical protein